MRLELKAPISLGEISRAIDAPLSSPNDRSIYAITTDTREAMEGDLFIALAGDGDSGEKYVCEALKKGCYVISASMLEAVMHVADTSEALLKLAEYYKSTLGIKSTVAITGSVGKSTTVKFLRKILSYSYKVHSPIGNFNNAIGVPLTILSAPKDTEVLILEMGMNHKTRSLVFQNVHIPT